ncbi:MAG: arsenic resistance protein [Aquificaceae bacterium]
MPWLRLLLEKYQAFIYLVFIILGVALGSKHPTYIKPLENMLSFVIAFLLYATFCQVPLAHLPKAFLNYRLLLASLVGNFILVPLFVGLILLPIDSMAVKVGIAMVLLVPCTDWFITFSYLGKAQTKHAIALLPILLFLQLILLPFYLLIFFPHLVEVELDRVKFIKVFFGLIAFPLFLAYITQRLVDFSPVAVKLLNLTGWLPVPLISLIVFIIFGSYVETLFHLEGYLLSLTFVFSLYLVFALFLSKLLARAAKLTKEDGRVLAFNLGTRNSFLVLPIALALPEGFQETVFVIVYQTLIELLGMLFFVHIVPRRVFPEDKMPVLPSPHSKQ